MHPLEYIPLRSSFWSWGQTRETAALAAAVKEGKGISSLKQSCLTKGNTIIFLIKLNIFDLKLPVSWKEHSSSIGSATSWNLMTRNHMAREHSQSTSSAYKRGLGD